MAIIKADSSKMIDAAEEILKLTKEYSSLVDELFDKLGNINKSCWKSKTADSYVSKVRSEKLQYKMIENKLLAYGNYMKNAGTNLERVINKWS